MVGHRENQPANTRLLVRYIYGGSPRAFLRPENRRVNILSLCAGIRGKRKLTNVLSAWRRGPTENLCADLPKSRRRLAYLPRAAFRPNPEKTTDGRSCHIRLESLRAQILRPDWILLLTGFRRRAQFCTGSHSHPCFRRISQHRPGLPPQVKFRFLARGPAAQTHLNSDAWGVATNDRVAGGARGEQRPSGVFKQHQAFHECSALRSRKRAVSYGVIGSKKICECCGILPASGR